MIVIDIIKIHNRMKNIDIPKYVNGLILLMWLRKFIFSIPCIIVQLL